MSEPGEFLPGIEIEEQQDRPADEREIDIPVHPVAALFPMLPERELEDLAEDIRQNGLRNPIVRDDAGQLIDGRNRYAACRRAGVEPDFVTLDGQEPIAFILSQNLARRHLLQGQRAVAVIMASENFESKLSVNTTASTLGISAPYLNKAAVIVRYARSEAEKVLDGSTSFDQAYLEARRCKEDAVTEETKLRRIGRYAPDLTAMVAEGRLTLATAEIELANRRAAEEQKKLEAQRYLVGLTKDWLDVLSRLDPRAADADDNARQWLNCDPALLGRTDDVSAERARLCADTLLRYARMKEERDGEER